MKLLKDLQGNGDPNPNRDNREIGEGKYRCQTFQGSNDTQNRDNRFQNRPQVTRCNQQNNTQNYQARNRNNGNNGNGNNRYSNNYNRNERINHIVIDDQRVNQNSNHRGNRESRR